MHLTDGHISILKYRSKAADYDASAQFTMPLRTRAIALLQFTLGNVVLDVGAGTGLSYSLLLAFEQSPEMFEQAQARCAAAARANGMAPVHQRRDCGVARASRCDFV
jgi:arsenite methyltransferase